MHLDSLGKTGLNGTVLANSTLLRFSPLTVKYDTDSGFGKEKETDVSEQVTQETDMEVDLPYTPERQPPNEMTIDVSTTPRGKPYCIETFDEVSSQFQCNYCGAYKECEEVTQCCDGHAVCQKCIEPEVKAIFASDSQVHINCPINLCESEIPIGEAKKILPSMVIDLVQDKMDKYCLESINNMPNMFKCPDCGVPVEMAPGNKEFQCQNEDCMMTCCCYCKKPWNDRDYSSCSPVLLAADDIAGMEQLPQHWDPMPDKDTDFIRVKLQPGSEEYKTVIDSFRHTMRGRLVKSIRRIQNPRLWQKYLLTRKHMLDDFGAQKLNEQLLFHGSNAETVNAICKEGFDWRLCGRHGTMFGKGTYFAKDASYSDGYSHSGDMSLNSKAFHRGAAILQHPTTTFSLPPTPAPHLTTVQPFPRTDKTGRSKLMLCAKVLCGRMTAGNKRMLRPPPDPGDLKQRPFNSAVDNPINPSMFVIFESSQTYPEYVLEYL
ncbi:uncharacterized protein LOC121381882 [Gigantopelta aegis]|uniref:uncharacterized protein LOC121381882 n=1 Tax=Gigantopelta aegis TaxID=1735272 RepID=UPI001B8898A6|nr:uncharacterized protein LOC121381882 [Gigantopelta aegis]